MTQVWVATQVMVVIKNMMMIQTWVVTHVVTPVRREAMAKHSSTTPGLFALVVIVAVVVVMSNGNNNCKSFLSGDGDDIDIHLKRR